MFLSLITITFCVLQNNLHHWCLPEDAEVDRANKIVSVGDHIKPVCIQCANPLSDSKCIQSASSLSNSKCVVC